MTKTEIDHALALAIGYADDDVMETLFGIKVWHNESWWRFDHKDPAVIWPIAERFDAFPVRNLAYSTTKLWGTKRGSYGVAHNPATATALAVIEHCKKGKP